MSELKDALDVCGFKLPGWKVRQLIEEIDDKKATSHVGQLSLDEFEKVSLFKTLLRSIFFIMKLYNGALLMAALI